MRSVLVSARIQERLERALDFVAQLDPGVSCVLVGSSQRAVDSLAQRFVGERKGRAGTHRLTLPRFAATLAEGDLARAGKVPGSPLVFEALATRLVRELPAGEAARFGPILDKPGLPRALVRTLGELRLEGVARTGDADLDVLLARYGALLDNEGFADAADVFAAATQACADHPLAASPLVFLDVALPHALEERFVAALSLRATGVLYTLPRGDDASLTRATRALGAPAERLAAKAETTLARVQANLFEKSAADEKPRDATVVVSSAPGESREAVEIARAVLREAEKGVRFDDICVALRNPELYTGALVEAFARAKIPAYFAKGVRTPDPSGRALLALLRCAEENLAAHRFAEYLSLGEVPDASLRATAAVDTVVLPDEADFMPNAFERDRAAETQAADTQTADTRSAREPAGSASASATRVVSVKIATPRKWEQLIDSAAVIGTLDRWTRRLTGLAHQQDLAQRTYERNADPRLASLETERGALAALSAFALPLLAELDALRTLRAPWRVWLGRLDTLAQASLHEPARVRALLAELAPLTVDDPVELGEVRAVLSQRLGDLVTPGKAVRGGAVYVAPIALLRGEQFRVVFVPGVAERVFPAKVSEDPILLDRARESLNAAGAESGGAALLTNVERNEAERLLFRLALGAASQTVYVSYPRLDLEQGRPRTPSYYLLELERVATGRVIGFDELALQATEATGARVGWPAPPKQDEAIDEAEHDLSLLRSVLDRPETETIGTARYLLSANPHLARALRARGRRWLRTFSSADGLVDPAPEARAILQKHALTARSFSPTALQNYAACPYRFFLYAVHKLSPRREKVAIEEMNPLERGSMVHETLYVTLTRLRDEALLPVTPATLDAARDVLDRTLDEIAAKYKEELFPLIERVWEDAIQSIRADTREWLRRLSEDQEFVPAFFELSFGLENNGDRDAHSRDEDVALECGIRLRGSIDLVERTRSGELRATDYKTGKVRATKTTIIGGGQTLQPVFYALVLEKLFANTKVRAGRLYYASSVGGFETYDVALDQRARDAAGVVGSTVGGALDEAFFPAYPEARGCEYCDYKTICGPYEEVRAKRKQKSRLDALAALRKWP